MVRYDQSLRSLRVVCFVPGLLLCAVWVNLFWQQSREGYRSEPAVFSARAKPKPSPFLKRVGWKPESLRVRFPSVVGARKPLEKRFHAARWISQESAGRIGSAAR